MHRRAYLLAAAIFAFSGCKKEPPKEEPKAAATPTGTIFGKVPPAVGNRREESTEMTMTVTMSVDVTGQGQNSAMTASETVKHTDEVLAVRGDAVDKVKVTFGTVASKRTEGGKDKTEPSAVSGKAYLVESKGGKIEVRNEQGQSVPADEDKEVRKHVKNLGKADPMFAALPSSALAPGQKVDAIAKAITLQLAEEGEAMTVKDVSVTFKEVRGDDGVFDVALKLTKNEGPMAMEIDVRGEALVSIKTGWPTKTTLEGPIRVGGSAGGMGDRPSSVGMNVSGSGRMSMKLETKSL